MARQAEAWIDAFETPAKNKLYFPFSMVEVKVNAEGIGVLQESSLHAALKRRYSRPGDDLEVKVDGFVIDIVRGDLLIEIQTRHFSALKRKLIQLTGSHPVRLVYPIAREKWIIKEAGGAYSRRKSPRRGCFEHLFIELVRIPELAANPNFSLEVLMTREEELQTRDGRGSRRRRGWSIQDRRLIEIVDGKLFASIEDYRSLLPAALPPSFTTRDLAAALRQPLYLSQKMAYCLRKMGVIHLAGKRGRSYLYVEEQP